VTNILKFLLLLSLVLWLGGILFFAVAVAPSVFSVLTPVEGGRLLAGNIVNRSLGILHWMGITCGIAFLLCSSALARRFINAENILALAMIVLTAISQFVVSARMAGIRAQAGSLERLAMSDPLRLQFARLHQVSTALEGVIFLLGLVVIVMVSRRLAWFSRGIGYHE
jgi:uncharacterized membrane protein